MKRNFYHFTIYILLLLFSLIIGTSCDIELKDSTTSQAPTVQIGKSGVIVTVPPHAASTNYINIYRRDVTKVDNNPVYEKIGIIYPGNYPANTTNYIFEDFLVSTGTYQYCVRHSTESTQIRSAWSRKIDYKQNENERPTVYYTYSASSLIDILYDGLNQTIELQNSLQIPDSLRDYEPMLVVTSDSKKAVFPLPDSIRAEDPNFLGTIAIPLVSVLSDDFLYSSSNPTEIKIEGIIGQKKNFDLRDNPKMPLSVTWTPVTKATIRDKNKAYENTYPEITDKLKVISPTGQAGYDWSDLTIE